MNILITDVRATPSSSTVKALNDVTLTCSPITTGATAPDTYSWHRVGGNIPSQSSGQDSATLTIHRIVPKDAGQSYCLAEFFGHCAISNNVTVTVESGKEMISYIIFSYIAIYICIANHIHQLLNAIATVQN